jgi:DNA helicase-2/ATP-dependent DNA helicase PcrA
MRSTRETRVWARPYIDALHAVNIRAFNPRAKNFTQQEEVKAALGALIAILDPSLKACPGPLVNMVGRWDSAFRAIAVKSHALSDYVERACKAIAQKDCGEFLKTNVMELFYIILSFHPFPLWQEDIENSARLAKLTRILEVYTSMPQRDNPTRARNVLATSRTGHQVSYRLRRSFYWGLCRIMDKEGLDDDEDEYDPFPPGRLPIMTIFQAKGLQFPFVFVATSEKDGPRVSGVHEAEDLLQPFRRETKPPQFSAEERAAQDYARLFYVAHSRAQYGLIILATDEQAKASAVHLGPKGANWVEKNGGVDLASVGARA